MTIFITCILTIVLYTILLKSKELPNIKEVINGIDDILLSRLHTLYKKYGQIVIAVDYDDTIVALTTDTEKSCKRTRDLLQLASNNINCKIIIYTSRKSDLKNLGEIASQCEKYSIIYDEINKNIIEGPPSPSKLVYNILLDDKSGLYETQNTLERFINDIISSK